MSAQLSDLVSTNTNPSTHLSPQTALGRYFTDKGTENQRRQETNLRSPSKVSGEFTVSWESYAHRVEDRVRWLGLVQPC